MNDLLPPGLDENDQVILFDGVCKLCNGWSRFIIRYDTKNIFKLCAVQSPEGQAILQWFGYPTDKFDTMLLIQGNQAVEKSDAFLAVVQQLPFPWKFAYAGHFIPKIIRDWLYDRVALNRYKLFGRYDMCLLPEPSQTNRFLG